MALSAVVLAAVPAVAGDAVSTITTATTDFLPSLLTVGGIGIGIGAGVLLLRRGWGLVKGLIK